MRIIRFAWIVFVFLFLTVLTQIGGVVYFVSLTTHTRINKSFVHKMGRRVARFISFLLCYLFATFLVVPLLAKPFGRVPLPLVRTNNLRPLNFLTCLLNRHYVRPQLRQTILAVSIQMNRTYPGTVVNYLDANFPFINSFPLFPHRSHDDGNKLDIAFCYIDRKTGLATNSTPSSIGYGISEQPRSNEVNTPDICGQNGYWQYSLLMKIMPQGNKRNYIFDSTRTKELVRIFASTTAIRKIFIEPHLKTRLALTSDKIRFHGCPAVRHDDHIHIQLD